jgi:putative ABC transport system substrate-binding protein
MSGVLNLRQLGVLFDASDPIVTGYAKDFVVLAQTIGVHVRLWSVRNLDDIRTAVKAIQSSSPQVLVVLNTPLTAIHRDAIMRPTAHLIPVVGEGKDFAAAGAVITYAPNFYEMYRRSASYIDRILKGANAGDLPIEQPTRFELIVNLRSARVLRLAVPESIVLRADEVIR